MSTWVASGGGGGVILLIKLIHLSPNYLYLAARAVTLFNNFREAVLLMGSHQRLGLLLIILVINFLLHIIRWQGHVVIKAEGITAYQVIPV